MAPERVVHWQRLSAEDVEPCSPETALVECRDYRLVDQVTPTAAVSLAQKVGSLQLRIPKLRQGSYFPPFLEPSW